MTKLSVQRDAEELAAGMTSLGILGASVGVLEGQRHYRLKRRRA